MTQKQSEKQPVNFLCDRELVPERKSEEFYEDDQTKKLQYGVVWGPQSHMRRRKLILQKHPQVAKLLIPTKPYSIILTLILVPLALGVNYLVKDASWPVFLTVLYVVGGTINHTLHVLIHDFTHWAGHSNLTVNKGMAIICNIPMGFPSAISFGKYHNDHHNFLGQKNKDPDLPLQIQSMLSKNIVYKFFFMICISLVYAFRPLVFMRKALTLAEIVNLVVILCSNAIIYKFWGGSALLYLLLGAYLSIGPHPASMHVIAEHYEFAKGLETYDYFGMWNFFNLDLGYHIEHHDFPTCPWYNLRKVRAMAPEFYEKLPHHTSYAKVAWKFLTDNNFNLYNRTLRLNDKKVN